LHNIIWELLGPSVLLIIFGLVLFYSADSFELQVLTMIIFEPKIFFSRADGFEIAVFIMIIILFFGPIL
jgi:hypothetical protein